VRVTAKAVRVSAFRIEVKIESGTEKKVLYFESDFPFWEDAPINEDYAAVALFLYCASRKQDIYIDGRVTESLLHNLDEYLKIWSLWKPELYKNIKIGVKEIVPDKPFRDLPAVMAFSGGLDASFSLADHQARATGNIFKEIRTGILIVGFDLKEDKKSTINLAYKNAKHSVEDFGADCAVIKTNWQQELCPDWTMGYDAGVACILHTLASHYSCGILSGTISFLQELGELPYGCNMMTNHLLGSYTFPVILTGGTHTRFEKAGFVGRFPALQNRLRVCWQPLENGINCGECEKCVRTRLEMLAYGLEPDIFNLPLDEKNIENLDFSKEDSFEYFKEIYLNFPRNHRYYPVIEKVYRREKNKLYVLTELTDENNQKNDEILRLKNERDKIKALKTYRITRPLRFLGKIFNRAGYLFKNLVKLGIA